VFDETKQGLIGKPTLTKDAAGIETVYHYIDEDPDDPNYGRLEKTTRAGITSGTTEYYTDSDTYDPTNGDYDPVPLVGRIKATTDTNGNVTFYQYQIEPDGAFGYSEWVEKRITYQNHGTADVIETYTIADALGRTLESQGPKGIVTINRYSDDGRLEYTATKHEGIEVSRAWYDYNPDGSKREDRVQYRKDSSSWLPVRVTSYTYDLAGRLIRTDYPDDTFTATRYYPEKPGSIPSEPRALYPFSEEWPDGLSNWIGRAELQYARDGKISVTKYDLAGRVKETYTLVLEGDGVTAKHKSGMAYTYNKGGKKKEDWRLTISGRTMVKEYEYNSEGRLWKTIDTINQVTLAEYGYDKAGRQIWTKNANDVYTANEYDSQYGRLVRVNYGVTTLSDDYTDGDASTPETLGATDETYVRYVYDDDGRKREEWRPEDGGLSPLEICTYYDYDDQGRQTKIIYNYQDGVTGPGSATDAVYETVYNKYGERTAIIDATGHYTWFEYDDFGRLWRKILDQDGNGVKEIGSPDPYEEYTYDLGRGLLTEKRNYDGSEIQYEYDNVTDRRTAASYPDGSREDFTYELDTGRLLRVVEADAGGHTRTTTYTYDPITGKPAHVTKSEGALTYEYNDLSLLSTVTGSRPGAELSMQYYYDALGRLEEVHSPTGIAKYAYHDDGSRASLELPNGVLTRHTYDHVGHLTLMRHEKGASVRAEFAYEVGRSGKRRVRTPRTESMSGVAASKYAPLAKAGVVWGCL